MIENVNIDIVKLDEELPLPQYAHYGDGGLDLYATEDIVLLRDGGRALIGTGIAISIPFGYCGFIVPRSGLALKHGISIVNAPGLIDSAYRGEIKVVLINTDKVNNYEITRGDRIAQLVIQKINSVNWNVVQKLDEFDRGGGFGHSGV